MASRIDSVLVIDVADGYSARRRTWLPADPLTVFTKGCRFVTCCGLLGSATLPFHCQCVERVCANIHTYFPLYKHCRVSPEVSFATKCNKMRAGQYASGLSSRTGSRSHIFSAESKLLYSCHKNHISRANHREVFPHTIGVSESL